jgi:uncharacterized lipoprotein YajG
MLTFVQNLVGVILLAGIVFLTGCSLTQQKHKPVTNVFSLPKMSKTEKNHKTATVEDFISQPRL